MSQPQTNVTRIPSRRTATVVQLPLPKVAKQKRGAKVELEEPEVGQMRYGIRAYMTKEGKRFLAQVRIKGFDAERQVFAVFMDAYRWQQARAVAIRKGGAPKALAAVATGPGLMMLTGPDGLLMRYLAKMQSGVEPLPNDAVWQIERLAGCSKLQIMGKKPRFKSLAVRVADINLKTMVEFCEERQRQGVKPQTVVTEYSRISVALKAMMDWNGWTAFPYPLPKSVRESLFARGLLAEPEERERRPERGEFPALIKWFTQYENRQRRERPRLIKQREEYLKGGWIGHTGADGERVVGFKNPLPKILPMADMVTVAVLNSPRRSTMLGMRWSLLDVENCQIKVLVKDRKKGKYQVDTKTKRREHTMPLFPHVVEILLRQPRIEGEDRIFPYTYKEVETIWRRARRELVDEYPNIESLRFHDLRHEAITTIAKTINNPTMGMQFTGHRSFRAYKRYTNFNKQEIKAMAQGMAHIKLPK